MPSQDAHGLNKRPKEPAPGTPATYSALSALRGMTVQLLFLALATPEHPVAQAHGRLVEVTPQSLRIEVDGRLPHLEASIRFGVELFGPTGLVHFFGRLTGRVEEGATSLTLALPEKVEMVQRRRFARAPFSGEIHYQPLLKGKPGPLQTGIAIDLSAGGLKMSTTSPLKDGHELLIHFRTPDGRAYQGIPSRVVRMDHQGDRFTLACRFEALTEVQEAALVQAVFRMQLRSAAASR